MYEQLITIILVALVLGLDAFSLSMGMGLKGVTRDYEVRFAFTVAVLHVIMPLVGLGLGMAAGKFLGVWAARVGALVLAYIASDLLIKGYRELQVQTLPIRKNSLSFSREASLQHSAAGWGSILILAVSVSIDALTVGFGLGTLKVPVLTTVIMVGITAGAMTLTGFYAGKVFSRVIGSYAQLAGGIILLALAVKLIL
ncbi:MAG: manganese efflux pump [Syntrophomonadaceae bacterium]|nr:manganese efflux pump [Syntrophomonadaceae bacterium]